MFDSQLLGIVKWSNFQLCAKESQRWQRGRGRGRGFKGGSNHAYFPLNHESRMFSDSFHESRVKHYFTRSGICVHMPGQKPSRKGIQSFRTHGSFVPRRFVPRLKRFVPIFGWLVPNSLVYSYPPTCTTKFLKF